ncbi:MAG: hypothetical protein PVG82_01515 [Chromatiales bacterium]|jgi:hypothetical protein
MRRAVSAAETQRAYYADAAGAGMIGSERAREGQAMGSAPRQALQPLILEPRVSVRLLGFLLLAHGLALAATLSSDLSVPVRAGLAVSIGVSLAYHWRCQVSRRHRCSILRIEWLSEGEWTLLLASGERCGAALLDSSIVLPWLLVLHFRCEGGSRIHAVLPSDALDPDLARRLRARLRTRRRES